MYLCVPLMRAYYVLPSRQARSLSALSHIGVALLCLHVGTHTGAGTLAYVQEIYSSLWYMLSLSLSLAALRAHRGLLLWVHFACVKSRCHWLPTRLLCRLCVCVGYILCHVCVCVCCIYCLFDQFEMISFQIQRAADK